MLKTVPGSKERSARSHAHVRKFAFFHLLSLFFLQDLFQKKEESFTLLFLLRIVSSYHRNNSIGYSKFYLGFLKEYERRTGRIERGLKKL